MAQRGLLDQETEDPFSLFVASTSIRYCYYSDTHKVLGNTFGMCVLQVSPAPLEQWLEKRQHHHSLWMFKQTRETCITNLPAAQPLVESRN